MKEKIIKAKKCKKIMLENKKLFYQSASEYRKAVKDLVNEYDKNNLSRSQAARDIGITEGSIRSLLRDKNQSRSQQRKRPRS